MIHLRARQAWSPVRKSQLIRILPPDSRSPQAQPPGAGHQGAKPPKAIACRLMDKIRRDPEYRVNRLRELAVPVRTND